MVNCTLIYNIAGQAGGGISSSTESAVSLTNGILWGNSDVSGCGSSAQVHNASFTTPDITYSCVQGGQAGAGNISANPVFADADGRVSAGSPFIDAGSNAAVSTSEDFDGNPRIADGDGDGTTTVDMGAHEYPRKSTKGWWVGTKAAGERTTSRCIVT